MQVMRSITCTPHSASLREVQVVTQRADRMQIHTDDLVAHLRATPGRSEREWTEGLLPQMQVQPSAHPRP
jgi:hypothetical protein